MDRLAYLKDFFKRNKLAYIVGFSCLLIIDLVQVFVPQILKAFSDDFQNGSLNLDKVKFYALLMVLSGIVIAVGRAIWRLSIFKSNRLLEYELRRDCFENLLYLSPDFFGKYKTGDLMAHMTNDVSAVRKMAGPALLAFVDAIIIIISTVFMMIKSTGLKITLMAIAFFPLSVFIISHMGKIIYGRFKFVQEVFSDLSDNLQESFSGIRVIKSFAKEKLFLEEFENINDVNYKANLSMVKVNAFMRSSTDLIMSLAYVVAIIVGGKMVLNDSISLGDLVAFIMYLGLLVWPTRYFGVSVNVFQRGMASMDRLSELLKQKTNIKESLNPVVKESLEGYVEFKDVSFKYKGAKNYALKDINFKLEPGKTLAILGRTGSGKSTVANLLLRLFDTDSGSIYIDGVDIKDMSLKSIRENIGYVPSDSFLFSESILENIGLYNDEKVSLDEAEKFARLVEFDSEIEGFSDKYDTILGERGVNLSGGQKQRLSIARALIKDADIYILDDSLSAVDTETEAEILDNLSDYLKKRSVIIIAHRVSTIKNADEIIYLEDGEIIERGTHEELIALAGSYKTIYENQLLEEGGAIDG
ncbi:MAG: ABC transporter ATP-binding protein [Tissierellia bacterium]|nr:ABC transporter ATP-binding protein [Tissierellia bacterium]